MEEQLRHTEVPCTHIPDEFTVFFYGNRVYIGKRDYPIGQCGVDVMNMDGAVIGEIVRRTADFAEAAHALLEEDTNAAAQFAQETLNAVWDVMFSLPMYRRPADGLGLYAPLDRTASCGQREVGAGADAGFECGGPI